MLKFTSVSICYFKPVFFIAMFGFRQFNSDFANLYRSIITKNLAMNCLDNAILQSHVVDRAIFLN